MTLENGYEMKTTFWSDFSIADRFGINAVKDTFKRAFEEWKGNFEYVTELSIVLNLKIWQHWENGNNEIATIYDEFWRKCDNYILDNFSEEKVQEYLRITD